MKKLVILSIVLVLVLSSIAVFSMVGCKTTTTVTSESAAAETTAAVSKGITLNMLSWYDEAVDKTFKEFENKYGIKINFTVFESNEEAYNKLKTDPSSFDILQGDGMWPVRYYKEGMIQEWDPTQYSSWEELNKSMQSFALDGIWKGKDKGTIIAYPGSSGAYYIVARKDKVPEGINKWSDLWDKKFEKKIAVTPQGNEMIAMTALGMGAPLDQNAIYNAKGDDLKKIAAKLLELKPNTRMIWSSMSEAASALEQGDAWVAFFYAKTPGFYLEKDGFPVWNVIPEDKTVGWVNSTMINSNTKYKKECEQFINYLYSAEARMNRWTQMEKWDHMVDLNSKFVQMLKDKGEGDYVTYMDMDHPENAMQKSVMFTSPDDVASYVEVWNQFMVQN